MKKRWKILLGVLGVIGLILAVGVAGAAVMFREQLAAMNGIRKLEDGLYTMCYEGDYGFEDFLQRGGASSDEEVGAYLTEFLSHGFYQVEPKTQKQGCSTLQMPTDEGGYLFGRNYDWTSATTMIVQTKPEHGYASVSTCNMEYLGFGEGYLPEGFVNKMMGLSAVYVPLDGMNEMGLCVADLMIDTEENTCQDTGKANLTTTTAIRLLLDQAADVDEAVALLKQYDMHSSAGMMHHLAIADSKGNSVVAEYVADELVITQTKIVTNFYLAAGEKHGIGSEQSKRRYELLTLWQEEKQTAALADMKDAMLSVSQGLMGEKEWKTVWTILYDQSEGTLTYYFDENYDKHYDFSVT